MVGRASRGGTAARANPQNLDRILGATGSHGGVQGGAAERLGSSIRKAAVVEMHWRWRGGTQGGHRGLLSVP